MEKHDKQWASSLAVLAVMGVLVDGVRADGYRNPPPTAAGIGKSGVNRVFVDDASAISYNPANLTLVDGGSLVVDMTIAHTESTYNGPHGKVRPDDPWQPLPNTYVAMPSRQDGIVFGFGISTPYGQGSSINKYGLLAANTNQPSPLYDAKMMVLDFGPSVGIKLSDSLSVGLGADIIYSTLEFKQHYPWGLLTGGFAPDGDAEAEGDGIAFGGNLGVTWKPVDRHTAVFTYRSPFKMEYDGDFKVSNFQALPPIPGLPDFSGTTPASDFSTEIEFPTILAFGYGVELTDSIRIEANVEWLEWSRNESMTIDLGNNAPLISGQETIPNNWNNTFTFGVGGEWQVCENWTLRSGYAFIETPIPDATLSPILPDADRHALSFGAGYSSGAHTVDVAYTFSFYDDRTTPSGTYDIDSDLVGLTYSYSF